VERQHPRLGQLDEPINRRSFRGHWHCCGDECVHRLLGCKVHVHVLAPVTAIRAGDTDGNPKTDPDPAWTSFIVTPSHPEYPAAHTSVGASALGFYKVWFGTDEFPLAFKGIGGAVRNYTSVDEIHAEEGNARVWGGMHFRNSTEEGTALGNKVGKYTAKHLLKLLHN
jgi:hypothetical protein